MALQNLLRRLALVLLMATGSAHAAGYGALFYDPAGGAEPTLGWAYQQPSTQAAEGRAARECAQRAGHPCAHGSTFSGQCAAFVHGYGPGGSHRYNIFQSALRGPAEAKGMAVCHNMGNAQCRVVGWVCSH